MDALTGQFKAIIASNKYLGNSDLYYFFMCDGCVLLSTQLYICDQMNLHKSRTESPCETQILGMKDISTGNQ